MSSHQVVKDYYKVLELPRTADISSIKSSYRRLARIQHPDKNSSSTATSQFQLLQQAYSTLVDPTSRSIYDASYLFTNSPNATSPQANQSTNTAQKDRNEARQRIIALGRKIQQLNDQLRRQEADLHRARTYLVGLHREMSGLQQEIKDIEREQSENATWLGYFASLLQGHLQTEVERFDREYHRLQKIAARSIKNGMIQRQTLLVEGQENAIRCTQRSIASAEAEVQKEKDREKREEQEKMRMEEERLRQEANRKMAEKLRKQHERQAQQARWRHGKSSEEQEVKESHKSSQGERKRNRPTEATCHHQGWWSRVDGRSSCSYCLIVTRKFAFRCPGCTKLACASCRDLLKGRGAGPNPFGKGSCHRNPRYSYCTSDFGEDLYYH
ncbi:uncharacterized protein LDX57_013073 [Aspergillus melleus]|uniref:uncharacterized protein n=1 Tax=Aspergillus melleus TaxID=138277 RepID=UPI001E8DB475|nr:uncharacterized protein LDX57_013073 [Aspergillus melleus]KAH8434464.1 hypothetical protein LDX57_013073 [Aspergillus melleus]